MICRQMIAPGLITGLFLGTTICRFRSEKIGTLVRDLGDLIMFPGQTNPGAVQGNKW